MIQTQQQVTSTLNLKFVAAYFKAMHKERDIRVQRREDGSLYMSDGMLAVNVPLSPDLWPFIVFADDWQRATFCEKKMIAEEKGPDIEALFTTWNTSLQMKNYALTLTPFLLEIPGATNKPGTLSRKFTYQDSRYIPGDERYEQAVYIEKRMMDMLNPDLDSLRGFLFETSGKERPVRVSAANGIVAYLMPKQNIERYLEVQS